VSELSRRPNRTPRRTREQRAYRLVVVGGTAAAVAVVGFFLAIIGTIGLGLPLVAAAVAAAAALLFRGTVS
jgi:putative flippase GtrA